jgi:triosephosphate isomerase
MRKQIVAGNWKMNKTLQEGIDLAQEVATLSRNKKSDALVILCPPFIHLPEVGKVVNNNSVLMGAQNCADQAEGAYTGEVSAKMVASTGAKYVIIGHSERRAYYNETDETLATKVQLALENNLLPIFCIGEVLEQREQGIQDEVVKEQLTKGLFGLSADDFSKVVVAYEPVWAIGTGKTATPEQAQDMHKFIREQIQANYNEQIAADTTILYGGSCKPSNAAELFGKPDVDGGLIGGASLKAKDFIEIVNAF